MKFDVADEQEILEVLDRFCAGFASRDPEAVMVLFAPDPDIAVVTSEEPLLRGPDELRDFLKRYVDGPKTYSWRWERRDASIIGSVAWLLAEGTETATTGEQSEQHPYRMTVVLERRAERWRLLLVHGSSPH
jgi:uncharacterized protein (TIGR02246 family)